MNPGYGWWISFSDLLTLIVCFNILSASANHDSVDPEMKKSVKTAGSRNSAMTTMDGIRIAKTGNRYPMKRTQIFRFSGYRVYSSEAYIRKIIRIFMYAETRGSQVALYGCYTESGEVDSWVSLSRIISPMTNAIQSHLKGRMRYTIELEIEGCDPEYPITVKILNNGIRSGRKREK